MIGSSKERVWALITVRAKSSSDCCETYLVLTDIGRKVHVLEEHISNTSIVSHVDIAKRGLSDLQPLIRTTNLSFTDTRETASLEIIWIDGGKQHVDRVDGKDLFVESQCDDRLVCARDDETALTVALGSWDLSVDGFGVCRRGDDERRAGIENGGAASQSDVLAIHREGDISLPETQRVNVVEGDKGFSVEFGLVKAPERDLPVIETIRDPRKLVRSDGLGNRALICKGFNGGQDTLVGKR